MPIAWTDASCTNLNLVARIKEAILKSSDWAHLQLSTGTQATTLSSGPASGATTISVAATIPSGSTVVIGNGAAEPNVRVTTAVSGSGPYTVTLSEALSKGFASGAAVGVGTYCKATTTRGAEMVVDLADAAHSTTRLQLGVYQTHNGTTAGDKAPLHYVTWKSTAGATTNNNYYRVSASKEHLYLDVEGPRAAETGAQDSGYGSHRQTFGLFDLAPAAGASDTTPAVVLVSHTQQAISTTNGRVFVSRNRANSLSWVGARLRTLAYPLGYASSAAHGYQPIDFDGNYVTLPYYVFEDTAGHRGRLTRVMFGGFGGPTPEVGEAPVASDGLTVVVGGVRYRVIRPIRSAASSNSYSPYGDITNGSATAHTWSPLLFIPDADA